MARVFNFVETKSGESYKFIAGGTKKEYNEKEPKVVLASISERIEDLSAWISKIQTNDSDAEIILDSQAIID